MPPGRSVVRPEMGNCVGVPKLQQEDGRKIEEIEKVLNVRWREDVDSDVRPVSNEQKKGDNLSSDFHSLPNEMIVRILQELSSKDIVRMKVVSRRVNRIILDNWYHLPRPRLTVLLNFALEVATRNIFGQLKKNRCYIWYMKVNADYEHWHATPLKGTEFRFYEGGILRVRNKVTVSRTCAHLENYRDAFERRGYFGRIHAHKSGTELKYELRVHFPHWTTAFEECLEIVSATQYRFFLDVRGVQLDRTRSLDHAQQAVFYQILERFIRSQPVALDRLHNNHVHYEQMLPILKDTLVKNTGQMMKISYHAQHYWRIYYDEEKQHLEIYRITRKDNKTLNVKLLYVPAVDETAYNLRFHYILVGRSLEN